MSPLGAGQSLKTTRTPGRLLSVVLFACAVLVVGLALTGVLELRSRAPVAVVTR
jgi:hypothetical protein